METKTAAELVALVVEKIREHPEYDHIASVAVTRRIPQASHRANWRVEWTVNGNWHIPEGAYKIVERLQAQFNLACSDDLDRAERQCLGASDI
jgi:hypothetical protein